MSKYYKAEDVIKCVAQYIMTDAKRDNPYVCGDIEDYIEFTEAILADLPTIDIVHCKDCKNVTYTIKGKSADEFYACSYSEIKHEGKFFCSYGERKDYE